MKFRKKVTNEEEAKNAVENVIKDLHTRVFSGSIPENTMKNLITEIDDIYKELKDELSKEVSVDTSSK